MKNHLLLFCLLGIVFCPPLFSQQVSETLFGEPEWDSPVRIWEMPDGNLAAVTLHIDDNASPSHTYKLNHLDPSGAVLAQYDLPELFYNSPVEPLDDGTFTYGTFGSSNGVAAYVQYRIDLAGQIIDSIVYANNDLALASGIAVRSLPDGGFVLAIALEDFNAPLPGVRIVKVNGAGSVAFNKFANANSPLINNGHLAVSQNGRVAVAIVDFVAGSRVQCYNPTGALLWTKSLPQIPVFGETLFEPLGVDKVVLFGDAGPPLNGFAAAYNPNGSFAWNRTFADEIPQFNPVVGFADGDQFVLAGEYYEPGDIGLAVVKVAADGQTVFTKKFTHLGGYNMTGGMNQNGDYVFSGFEWVDFPFGFQSDNGYVLNLQPDGTPNWVAVNDSFEVNRMIDFCHLQNGDIACIGMAVTEPSVGQNFENFLFKISDIGPVYTQLIGGAVVHNNIENCEAEAGEPVLKGWIVKAETPAGNRYTVTDASGAYKIRLNANAANVSIFPPNDLWQPCEPFYPVALPASDTVSLNIPARQVAQCPLLTLDATTAILRRCFDNTYRLNWCNNGTAAAENAILTITLDAFMSYVSSSLPLASQSGQELTFQVGNVAPDQCGELTLVVHVSCEAELGQEHCLNALLVADETCTDHPHTAARRDCQPNTGSFDPNDKRAFVNDTLREGNVLPNTDIEYQIRFQNTGTDTAFHIVIVDTIANTLDISTLRPGISSHPYTFQLHGDRVVKFVFNNIQLPDSNINSAASNGFVNFTISQKPDLPLLTAIENKADIYFDFNDPVATNRQTLIVNESTSAPTLPGAVALIDANPNPAEGGAFWLSSRDPARTLQQVLIFDATGRLVQETQPGRNKIRLELPAARGVYWVKTLLDNGLWAAVRVSR